MQPQRCWGQRTAFVAVAGPCQRITKHLAELAPRKDATSPSTSPAQNFNLRPPNPELDLDRRPESQASESESESESEELELDDDDEDSSSQGGSKVRSAPTCPQTRPSESLEMKPKPHKLQNTTPGLGPASCRVWRRFLGQWGTAGN